MLVLAAVAALVATPDVMVARSVGVAAVVAAVGLGLLLRQRDRAARAALQLAATRRLRAEERFEEQLAEAEYAAEVAEERATRFGRRLTAEKSRLAKAETEIARLLRERAVLVAEQALREAETTKRAAEAARPRYPASPAAYVRAGAALRTLERDAARAEEAREAVARADESRRAGQVQAEVELRPRMPQPVPVARPQQEPVKPEAAVARPPRAELAARATLPAGRQRPAGRGPGFSFFGRPATAAALRAAVPAPSVGDLADVVGDEALAESERYSAQLSRPAAEPARPPWRPRPSTAAPRWSTSRRTTTPRCCNCWSSAHSGRDLARSPPGALARRRRSSLRHSLLRRSLVAPRFRHRRALRLGGACTRNERCPGRPAPGIVRGAAGAVGAGGVRQTLTPKSWAMPTRPEA
ncbi:hypothetical protein GCM10025734_48320 [Kitasatospora paranensis]